MGSLWSEKCRGRGERNIKCGVLCKVFVAECDDKCYLIFTPSEGEGQNLAIFACWALVHQWLISELDQIQLQWIWLLWRSSIILINFELMLIDRGSSKLIVQFRVASPSVGACVLWLRWKMTSCCMEPELWQSEWELIIKAGQVWFDNSW